MSICGARGAYISNINHVSTSGVSDASTSDVLLSPVVNSSFSSTNSSCPLSSFAGGGLLSAVSNYLLSFVAGSSLLSTVSDWLLLFVTGTVFCLLFLVVVFYLVCLLLAPRYYS